MAAAVYLAASLGIVALIARGYRYSSVLLSRGVRRAVGHPRRLAAVASGSARRAAGGGCGSCNPRRDGVYSSVPDTVSLSRLAKFITRRSLGQGPFKPESGQPAKQRLEPNARLDLGKVEPETGMRPRGKSQVPARVDPLDIEAVGLCEHRRITVGSPEHAVHDVVLLEADAAPLKWLDDMSGRRLHRTEPSHRLLEDLRNESQVVPDAFQDCRMLEQCPQRIQQQGLDGRDSAEEYDRQIALDLIVRAAAPRQGR